MGQSSVEIYRAGEAAAPEQVDRRLSPFRDDLELILRHPLRAVRKDDLDMNLIAP
jgi:hypothetical protein